jgi:redox-sensing transcriptional repressor
LVSEKTIGRLSIYRSMLNRLLREGGTNVFSHQLSAYAGVTSSQVRRDMMAIGHTGSPSRGYEVQDLLDDIGTVLDDPDGEPVAVVGVGNLGRALIAYFSGRRPKLDIAAGFDSDPAKVNRVIRGPRPRESPTSWCAPASAGSSTSPPCGSSCRRTSTSRT